MDILQSHIQNKAHVIWDWNGTLLSDIEHAVKVTNRLLKEEGLPPLLLDDYREVFGFPVRNYYEKLGFKTEPAYYHQLCERFNQHFYEELHTITLWPGAEELLRSIRQMGKKQSLLSASEQKMLESSIQLFGLEDCFDHIFGIADKLAGSKVDRGQELLKISGLAPKACVLIGDTDHDVEVGEALGIDVILVEHGHQHPARLREAHHTVVKVF